MFPYYVLRLPADADTEQVETRYRELVLQYPPDREGERFAAIQAAYSALRDERARVRTRLFYYDESGEQLLRYTAPDPAECLRPRLSEEELAVALRRRTP